MALTDTADIQVQGTLASGRPTNFTCAVPWACDRGTPPTFSWTRVALTSLHPESPRSSVLTLTPRPQDHGTNLTCRVTFPGAGVSTEVTIRLNVSYALQNLDIRIFWENSTGVRSLGSMESLRSWAMPPPCESGRVSPCAWSVPSTATPHQCKLGPGEPDPDPLPAFGSCGPRAAPGSLRGWRRGHLQRSAPERLQPCVLKPSCCGFRRSQGRRARRCDSAWSLLGVLQRSVDKEALEDLAQALTGSNISSHLVSKCLPDHSTGTVGRARRKQMFLLQS